MVRESLAAGARHASVLVTAGNGVAFQRRPVTNGESVHTAGSGSAAPRWVKLVRSGSTLTGFESANGLTWTQIGTQTLSGLAATVQVGLAVTSHEHLDRDHGHLHRRVADAVGPVGEGCSR